MKPYIPKELPLSTIDFRRHFKAVGESNAELARLDGLLQGLPLPELLLSPLINEEALLSSRIEGTQATITDVLKYDAGNKKAIEQQDDVHEVINYRNTMKFAGRQLTERPLSLGLIREMHQMLMDGTRGAEKFPGMFRTKQNYIGRPGATIEEATFVPPDPIRLQSDLESWERYVTGNDVEILLQCSIVHAQFELLHPFNDGNGRVGRLLIPLFLYQKKKLSMPAFYISGFLEKNREDYYKALRLISLHDDWDTWIEFFLLAVIQQAKTNSTIVKKILSLYEDMKNKIQVTTHSQYTVNILDFLFSNPMFQGNSFLKGSNIAKKTANKLLFQLKKAGIIQESEPKHGRTPATLIFKELLDIIEGIVPTIQD
ncbi:MAG: Fic family protein [Planctomycetaceae bacterium]|jgi:Fic family protein|nr:Fic family protein [Planctomycetaceae bacterium]